MTEISAIIPTYNNEDVIGECIQSLQNQTIPFDEIIVIDNNSTDKTRDIAENLGAKVYAIKSNRSEARNIGAKKSKSEILAFIESDSVYNKHWVEEVLKGFEKGYKCVIDRRAIYNPRTYIEKMGNAIFDMRYKNYKPFSIWAIKKDVFEEIGGFDENIEYSEDGDLGDRLLKEGYVIYFAKNAIQYHKGEPSTLREAMTRSWWAGLHAWQYYNKYPEKVPYIKILLYTLMTISIIFPIVFLLIFASLYLFLFVNVINNMEFKYAIIYPLYTILMRWPFYIGMIYTYFRKGFSKLNYKST